jgi:hypothetical protein
MYVCMYRYTYIISIPSFLSTTHAEQYIKRLHLASLCEPQVPSQVSSVEIHGQRTRSGLRYSPSLFVIPWVIIIPPLFHTHPSPPLRGGVPIVRRRQHINTTVTKLWPSPFKHTVLLVTKKEFFSQYLWF